MATSNDMAAEKAGAKKAAGVEKAAVEKATAVVMSENE